ncbi:MAG: glycosyltransferase [Candidatus Bathyarchaeota archaeon]|nr:glycosyltransferase [Candidatus Bathyarchaeota archaeon]
MLVLKTKKTDEYVRALNDAVDVDVKSEDLPRVTILIPAYNEEEIIYEKIKNISEFNYPREKIKVILLNDASKDATKNVAESAIRDLNLDGCVLSNEIRSGVNFSYNNAMKQVNDEYVLTTDADAIVPPDSLKKLVKILVGLKDVGGVAAKMIPVKHNLTTTAKTSISYNNMSNSMLLAESSIYSTFPGSTSCMLMQKSAFTPMSNSFGSSDGNISLGVIEKGLRFIWAPSVEYYEPISENILEQRRQKIRRATRLIQSTLNHREILNTSKYGDFSRTIFPLRFAMMTFVPIMILLSIPLFLVTSILYYPPIYILFLAMILMTVIGVHYNMPFFSFVISFLLHQVYLAIGLLSSYKSMHVWRKIDRSTDINSPKTNISG